MDGRDPRDLAIYEAREREDVRREHARDALKRKEVFVGLAQDELDARLLELYRTARLTVQETGSKGLFLAIGFLSLTRDAADTKRYRARAASRRHHQPASTGADLGNIDELTVL